MGSGMSCTIAILMGIVCGAIAANIMKSKGRSGGSGWALGLFLGIIGLIIAAVLPNDEEGIQQKRLETGNFKQCPYCRKVIDRQASICPYCRSKIQ